MALKKEFKKGIFTMHEENKVQFRDTGLYVYSSTDGQLDIVADTTVSLAATNISLTGAVTVDGALSGIRRTWETVTGDLTIVASDSGRVFDFTKSSATQTVTLPDPAAAVGMFFTALCGHADGEILINPLTGDDISIKATVDGANVTPAAGTGIKNTAASNVVGDSMTLVSNGVDGWSMVSMTGTWATQ